jgi:MerR family transcriptional regulator/heat shock protein HspR
MYSIIEKMSKERSERHGGMTDEEWNHPKYTISVVSQMFDVHPQTLRIYEREGLIKPGRTARKTRMYSEANLERLRSILSLTEIGVNLAGVEIVMRMRDQINEERLRFRQVLREIWERYKVDVRQWEDETSTELIPVTDRKVARIKKKEDPEQSVDTIDADEGK